MELKIETQYVEVEQGNDRRTAGSDTDFFFTL